MWVATLPVTVRRRQSDPAPRNPYRVKVAPPVFVWTRRRSFVLDGNPAQDRVARSNARCSDCDDGVPGDPVSQVENESSPCPRAARTGVATTIAPAAASATNRAASGLRDRRGRRVTFASRRTSARSPAQYSGAGRAGRGRR